MSGMVFTRAAQTDLEELWMFIASDNPQAADELEADIRAEVSHLVANPGLGHRRRDLTHHDLWFRTVHGSRDVVQQLQQPNPL